MCFTEFAIINDGASKYTIRTPKATITIEWSTGLAGCADVAINWPGKKVYWNIITQCQPGGKPTVIDPQLYLHPPAQ